MPYQYDPKGALNGLFAPAYIPGNPQSVAATTAWNANRGAPPVTPPAGAPPPFNPLVGGGKVVEGPGFQPAVSNFGGLDRPGPLPSQLTGGGMPAFDSMRNNIAQTLMDRAPSPNQLAIPPALVRR